MSEIYEQSKIVDEYLLFHYGSPEEILEWTDGPFQALDFPIRTVAHFSKGEVGRALDVGCAVGRSSFELSKTSAEVVGVDFSKAFIEAARRIGEGESLTYQRLEEGALRSQLSAGLPEGSLPNRVNFEVGDAMDLSSDLGVFDRVHAANLVCRLPEPRRFLERLPDLLRGGGELVLATPCTWLEEFTDRENWPKGRTLDWLVRELGASFELVNQADEPFLIRETARKYQWTVSMVTRWVKK